MFQIKCVMYVEVGMFVEYQKVYNSELMIYSLIWKKISIVSRR